MPSYRLYCLDGAGKIMTAEWLEAADDEAALGKVAQRTDYTTCELWDRERLVGRVRTASRR